MKMEGGKTGKLTPVLRGHGMSDMKARGQTARYFHGGGPAEMSSLLVLSASQLIRTPPSARGTNKRR